MTRESTTVVDGNASFSMTGGMWNALGQLSKSYNDDKAVRMDKINTNVRNRLLRAEIIRPSNPSGTFAIITERGKRLIVRFKL